MRIIDFHPRKPWYVSFVSVSPTNEWFVWNELVLKHDTCTTYDLKNIIIEESMVDEDDENNIRTLIDPLAKQQQSNTGTTVFEDLSRGENGLRHCEAADTKNSVNKGRQLVRLRLNNSLKFCKPFNNYTKDAVLRYGNYAPTIWFFNTCRVHIEHFKSWRTVDWKTDQAKAEHEAKREMEKWSDFCRNIEFLASFDPVWCRQEKSTYQGSNLFTRRR